MTNAHVFSFFVACVVLAVIPGPGMLYVIARTAAGGRQAGVQSAAGTAVGGSVHVLAAALGVSALVAASSQAYTVVRLLGAAYLIYLGLRTLREKPATTEPRIGVPRHSFTQGIITEVLNPKTAIFFLAFVPPFVPSGPPLTTFLWFLLLGFTSVFLNTAADVAAVFAATSLAGSALTQPSFAKWRQRGSGMTLVGMGLLAASHDVRANADR